MKKIFVCLLAVCLGMSFTVSAQTAYSKQKAKQATNTQEFSPNICICCKKAVSLHNFFE